MFFCFCCAHVSGEAIVSTLTKLRGLRGRTVVIKYGGHAMGSPAARASFASDVALLQASAVRCVVVHGGGPVIASLLGKLDIPTAFVDGMRVTDAAAVEAAEMALSGLLNKRTVHEIGLAGGRAIGLSGKDDQLLRCASQLPPRSAPTCVKLTSSLIQVRAAGPEAGLGWGP
jgi:acetylglutamate kinase